MEQPYELLNTTMVQEYVKETTLFMSGELDLTLTPPQL
jgi:hypothetical protein